MPAKFPRLHSAMVLGITASLALSGNGAAAQDIGSPASNGLGYFDGDYLQPPALSFASSFDDLDPETASAAAGSNIPWLMIGGLAIGVAVAMGGVGGGDGKAPGSANPDPAPQPGPIPNQAPYAGASPDSFETAEYRRDYTLGMINASTRYADGGTGKGTLLGVYDTGADLGHADLPNVVYSYSYFTGTSDVADYSGHGTHVAGISAGAKNDFGGHGVAFDAELAIFQGLGWKGAPARKMGSRASLADATRRAAGMGVVAMNHSWVFVNDNDTTRLITDFSSRQDLISYLGSDLINAFDTSVDVGMVSVFATGNDGAGDVSVLAGIPVYLPEYADNILAVGAIDSRGEIASFSNRCGIARDVCLVAPGVSVYSALSSNAGHPESSFGYMSGTSMAAPHVQGAIGVVKSNFQELTGAEISRILRDTATDLGAAGVDDVYGHGLLNLENAVAPQGPIVVKTGNTIHDGEIALDRSWIGGGAAADGLASSLSGILMMVSDQYDRGYSVDIGQMVSPGGSGSEERTSRLDRFVTAQPLISSPAVGISVNFDGVDRNDAANWADASAFSSAYAGLVAGPVLEFSRKTTVGTLSLRGAFDDDSQYAAAEIQAPLGEGRSLSLEAGQLSERDGFLGTLATGAFGEGLDSITRFARFAGSARVAPNATLHASLSVGTTDFRSSGVLAQGREVASQAIGFGLEVRNVLGNGDKLTAGISQPLVISGGQLILDIPVAMQASDGDSRATGVYRDRTSITLNAEAVPTDIQIGYSTSFFNGRAGIGGIWRVGRKNSLGVAAGMSFTF